MWVYLWNDNYSDYSAMQWPAPDGFHVPSKDEWVALCGILTSTFGMTNNSTTIGTYLKMPISGHRQQSNADISGVGSIGYYWSSTSYNVNSAYNLYILSSRINPQYNNYRSNGFSVRCFKNSPTIPTSSWTILYDGSSIAIGAWIFYSATDWLISVSGDGQTWYTIQDKNLGATTVFNQWDTITDANCGYFYQWWNNYGFPHSWAVTKSATKVDASSYWPGNYYNSSTFITASVSPYDWSSVQNDNLRWWVTGINHMAELKNAYIGEYGWKPWANTVVYYPLDSINTVNDLSWHNYTLTNSWSVAFWTNQWVDCAWFTSWGRSSWSRWLYRTSDTIITPQSTDLTFHVWLYKWSETMYSNPRIIGRYNSPIFTYASRSKISTADSTTYGITPVEWAWFLFSCVYKYSDKTWAYYLNGAYQNTQTNSTPASYSNAWIVLGTRDGLWTWYWDKWSWWMSNIIIENKVRTAQEVADYYNQNKSLYGIS